MRKAFSTLAGLALTIGALVPVAHADPPTPEGRCPFGWDLSKAQKKAERDADTNGDGFVCVKNGKVMDNKL